MRIRSRWSRAWRGVNPILPVAMLLVGLTWLAGHPDFRAQTVHGMVPFFDFPGGSRDWAIRGDRETIRFDPGSITLFAPDSQPVSVRRFIPLYSSHAGGVSTRLRVAGTIVRLGPPREIAESRARPMFALRYHGVDGPIDWGAVTMMTGQEPERSFEALVEPPVGTDRIEVVWTVRSAGHWRLDDLTIEGMALTIPYYFAVAALACAWLWVLFRLLRPLRVTSSPIGIAALLGILVVLVAGTGLARPAMSGLLEPLASIARSVLPPEIALTERGVQKLGHAVTFAILTMILLALHRRLALSIAGVALFVLSLALGSEALQRHRFNRSSQFDDVLIDLVGAAAGALLIAVFVVMLRGGVTGPRFVDSRRRSGRRRRTRRGPRLLPRSLGIRRRKATGRSET